MKPITDRDYIMMLIAGCDHRDSDAYEQNILRLARRWLRFLGCSQQTQGVVDSILEELTEPSKASYGCAWDDFRKRFIAWGLREEWIREDSPLIRG
jgi:hypothetical protein